MDDPRTNPDRDDQHQRRRDLGDGDEDPDGREVAEKLYGVPQVTQASNPDTDTEDDAAQ
jgi:hypothetical protein